MISIIIPVFQVEDYIEECLNSVINQTYMDIEIICVNDCTMDNSITIIKEFMKKDKRIRLINHIENKGLGGARNTGIEAANGEFILFVDSDDYIHKTMVSKLHNAIKQYNAGAVVCGIMVLTGSDQNAVTSFHYDYLAKRTFYDLTSDKEILTNLWPSSWNKLFRLSYIRKYNIRFKERILYEDHTFFYEYFFRCNNFAFVKDPLYFYRKSRPLSITSEVTGREKEIFQIIGYISELFKGNYTPKTAERLSAKIAIRLLYERRWVFSFGDRRYYEFLKKISVYLSKYTKKELLKYKDGFIPDDDPIFYTESEVNALAIKCQKNKKKKQYNFATRIKTKITTLPIIRYLIERKKRNNDLLWITWDTWKKIGDMSIKNEEHVSPEQAENSNDEDSNEFVKAALTEMENTINKKLYDLRVNVNKITQKSDDFWWLLWNIKDNLNSQTESLPNAPQLLRFYPTWIPTEYPEYFMGNTWYWADNFKEYYLKSHGNCEEELLNLKKGLPEASRSLIDIIWERNTKILPYSKYTDLKGMLLKTNMIFTSNELEEQHEIFAHYQEHTFKYILPEKAVYEIPVFYYEHGLKVMTENEKQYIQKGDILDVGAFVGDSALILRQYTSRLVYSLEIDSDNIQKMRDVLSLNEVKDKVKIINCGVGEFNEDIIYYGKESYSTLHNFSDVADIYGTNKIVAVKCIDTLVLEYGIEPHFIKMDIEGLEFEAIKGAVNTLKKYRPILCISIYHTAKDFLFIKPYIEALNLGYTFKIENHNPFDPAYEKMLMAMPPLGKDEV